jgi:hypothetical protein
MPRGVPYTFTNLLIVAEEVETFVCVCNSDPESGSRTRLIVKVTPHPQTPQSTALSLHGSVYGPLRTSQTAFAVVILEGEN